MCNHVLTLRRRWLPEQILWPATTHVGCASAACKAGGRLVVCSFSPASSEADGPRGSSSLPLPQPATGTVVPGWLPPSPPPAAIGMWRITALPGEDRQSTTSAPVVTLPEAKRQQTALVPKKSSAGGVEGQSSPPPPDSKRAGFMLRALALPLARTLETRARGSQHPSAVAKPADWKFEREGARAGRRNGDPGGSKGLGAGVDRGSNKEGMVPRDRASPPSPPPLDIYAAMHFNPYSIRRIEISSNEASSPPPAPQFHVVSDAEADAWVGVLPSPPPPDT